MELGFPYAGEACGVAARPSSLVRSAWSLSAMPLRANLAPMPPLLKPKPENLDDLMARAEHYAEFAMRKIAPGPGPARPSNLTLRISIGYPCGCPIPRARMAA
jgi:hypothetical protein